MAGLRVTMPSGLGRHLRRVELIGVLALRPRQVAPRLILLLVEHSVPLLELGGGLFEVLSQRVNRGIDFRHEVLLGLVQRLGLRKRLPGVGAGLFDLLVLCRELLLRLVADLLDRRLLLAQALRQRLVLLLKRVDLGQGRIEGAGEVVGVQAVVGSQGDLGEGGLGGLVGGGEAVRAGGAVGQFLLADRQGVQDRPAAAGGGI